MGKVGTGQVAKKVSVVPCFSCLKVYLVFRVQEKSILELEASISQGSVQIVEDHVCVSFEVKYTFSQSKHLGGVMSMTL